MMFKRIAAPLAMMFALAACGSEANDVAADDTMPATTIDEGPIDEGPLDEGPLDEGPLGAGTGAIGTVEITVTHPDIEPIVYTIGCMGDTFPVTPTVDGVNGEQACNLLADPAIFTLLTDGPPADQMCTEIFGGPDEAHIVGEVDGVAIDSTITRSNGCEIDAWESMIGLLPAPIGVS